MIIRSIGRPIHNSEFQQVEYLSDYYFLEADILIIDIGAIENELHEWHSDHHHYGKIIRQDDYEYIKDKINERSEQLNQYLSKGGNLFVFFPDELECKVKVLIDNAVEYIKIDLLTTIGLKKADFEIKSQIGRIATFEAPFIDFFKSLDFSYGYVFKKFIGYPICKVIGSNQTISLQIPALNGNIVVLPELQGFLPSKVTEQFLSIDKILKEGKTSTTSKIQAPEWVKTYSIENETIERLNLVNLIENKANIEKEIVKQNEALQYFDDLKRLLFSTGPDLEDIVEKVLIELGYHVQAAESGRDDLILSYNNEIIVAEIKGVKGSAAEKNAAQLMKWVNNYHITNDLSPKGLLIINAYREKPLSDRTDIIFPPQMIPYCQRMEICLVTTVQLLEIYLDYKALLITLNEVHDLFMSTIGVLKYEAIKPHIFTADS